MSAREPFQSLLRDIREATQTLANCAAKGKLNRDGTRSHEHPENASGGSSASEGVASLRRDDGDIHVEEVDGQSG